MKTPKEYFDKEYGPDHIKEVVEMGDIVSIYALMEEYAEKILKDLRKNEVVGRSEQLKAVERLIDFAYEVCPLHREDDLKEIRSSL